jgi:hypothetical protein
MMIHIGRMREEGEACIGKEVSFNFKNLIYRGMWLSVTALA